MRRLASPLFVGYKCVRRGKESRRMGKEPNTMSHEIDITNGIASFASAREHAWHRLGQILPNVMTAEEALDAAYLAGWNVRKTPLTTTVLDETGVTRIEIPGQYATVRTNPATGKPEVLGVVGEKYTPIQNEAYADLLNTLVDESGAIYETAGSLRGGRHVFLSMKLPESINLVLPGGKRDRTDLYLIGLNSHDGSASAKVLLAPVRVVCANTQAAALRSAKASYSFRHTLSAGSRIQEARNVLGMTFKWAEEFEREAQAMIEREITDREAKILLDKVFATAADDLSTRRENQIADVMHLYSFSDTINDVRGTAYGLYNAVTEWADHFQGVQGDDPGFRRAERVAFGQSGTLKQKAFAVLAG